MSVVNVVFCIISIDLPICSKLRVGAAGTICAVPAAPSLTVTGILGSAFALEREDI